MHYDSGCGAISSRLPCMLQNHFSIYKMLMLSINMYIYLATLFESIAPATSIYTKERKKTVTVSVSILSGTVFVIWFFSFSLRMHSFLLFDSFILWFYTISHQLSLSSLLSIVISILEKNVSIPRQTQSLPSFLIWTFRLGIEHDHIRMIIAVFRLREIFIAQAPNLPAAVAAQHTHSTPKWCICHYHFVLENRARFRWLNGFWSNSLEYLYVQCNVQYRHWNHFRSVGSIVWQNTLKKRNRIVDILVILNSPTNTNLI